MTKEERNELVREIADAVGQHPKQCLHFTSEDVAGMRAMAKHWSQHEDQYRGLLSMGAAYEKVCSRAQAMAATAIISFLLLAMAYGVVSMVKKELLK